MSKKRSETAIEIKAVQELLYNVLVATKIGLEFKDKALSAENYVCSLRGEAAKTAKVISVILNAAKSFISSVQKMVIESAQRTETLAISEPARDYLLPQYETLRAILDEDITELEDHLKTESNSQEMMNVTLPIIDEKIINLQSRHKLTEQQSFTVLGSSSVRSVKSFFSKESLVSHASTKSLPPVPENKLTGLSPFPQRSQSFTSLRNLRKVKFALYRMEDNSKGNETKTQDLSFTKVNIFY